jgi:hypothetical protein
VLLGKRLRKSFETNEQKKKLNEIFQKGFKNFFCLEDVKRKTSTHGGKVTGTSPFVLAFGGGLFNAAIRA